MSKNKTIYICSNCGFESLKWLGRCPSCEEWNSFTEELEEEKKKEAKISSSDVKVFNLNDNAVEESSRLKTGISEFDRVLGDGFMPGSVVLLGGDPGIGKSTLVMQAASKITDKVLYVTGEESYNQINLRAKRLKVNSKNISVLAETDLDIVLNAINKIKPKLVIVDSIQTMNKPELDNAPGTITQIRESANDLMRAAKSSDCSIVLVGHITKEGFIAGPKILEHMVDTVLQFEGERSNTFRILRAQKNRFGGTNEIGIFEMHDSGLSEVKNPSERFLNQREEQISGSAVTASMEGTRPVLFEVQALVTPTNYGNPQRVATGFDYRRLSILLAVLEKRANLRLSSYNVFLNMAGGLKINEPAVDLAVCCAIASSFSNRNIDPNIVAIGEVGLGGEIRSVGNIEKRLQEAEKLGFKSALIPHANTKSLKNTKIKIIPVKDVNSAVRSTLTKS